MENNEVCVKHYLPIWPVKLGKDSIICIDCPICHQHYGLAALTAPPGLVELDIKKKKKKRVSLVQIRKMLNKFVCHIAWLHNTTLENKQKRVHTDKRLCQ